MHMYILCIYITTLKNFMVKNNIKNYEISTYDMKISKNFKR